MHLSFKSTCNKDHKGVYVIWLPQEILPKALVLQDECFGKNYSSFLDFTSNYKRTSGIFVPWLFTGATMVHDLATVIICDGKVPTDREQTFFVCLYKKKPFCAFPWIVTITRPGGIMIWVCILWREHPKAQSKVDLEKLGIEPTTPGLQGIAFINYTTAAFVCLYKGRGDALDRGNYQGLKLTKQAMKILERINCRWSHKTGGAYWWLPARLCLSEAVWLGFNLVFDSMIKLVWTWGVHLITCSRHNKQMAFSGQKK